MKTKITKEEHGILLLLALQYTAAIKCRKNHKKWEEKSTEWTGHRPLPIDIGIATEHIDRFKELCNRGFLGIITVNHGSSIMAVKKTFKAVGLPYPKSRKTR